MHTCPGRHFTVVVVDVPWASGDPIKIVTPLFSSTSRVGAKFASALPALSVVVFVGSTAMLPAPSPPAFGRFWPTAP